MFKQKFRSSTLLCKKHKNHFSFVRRTYRMINTTTTSVANTDLFKGEKHSELYAQYRPDYPQELFDSILKEESDGKSNDRKLCILDVGCGSGQATLNEVLGRDAKLVIGIDPSEGQIKQAKQKQSSSQCANIYRFLVGNDENLIETIEKENTVNPLLPGENIESFENRFDLIIVAQSLHWFNFPVFFDQVEKLLSKNALFAAWTYTLNTFEGEHGEQATRVLNQFYQEVMWNGGYWPERRKHVDDMYQTIENEMPFQQHHKRTIIDYRKQMPLAAYISYVSTWSAIELYGKKNGNEAKQQLVNNFKLDLMKAFQIESDSTTIQILWNIHTIMTRKP